MTIGWRRVARHCAHGRRAIGGTDGRDALPGLDRRALEDRPPAQVRRHERDAELAHPLTCERQADEATAVRREEVDRGRRHARSRADERRLRRVGRIVDHEHDAASPETVGRGPTSVHRGHRRDPTAAAKRRQRVAALRGRWTHGEHVGIDALHHGDVVRRTAAATRSILGSTRPARRPRRGSSARRTTRAGRRAERQQIGREHHTAFDESA